MIGIGLAFAEPAISWEERRWRREVRSAWLRLAALLILLANILAGESHGNLRVHTNVLSAYTFATAVALALALSRRGPSWMGTAFVIVDAALVLALYHEHLFGTSGVLNTTSPRRHWQLPFCSFITSLRLSPHLVAIFSTIVLSGWLSLLVVTAASHWLSSRTGATSPAYWSEVALAAAFGFAGLVAFLLTRDHGVLLQLAIESEQNRHSLSRFFSPRVVAELQRGAISTDLKRREAVVMFVDLRSFTAFAEKATSQELTELLVEYRQRVTRLAFEWGGTVDKFIGDGVMAVFGHPASTANDARQALSCTTPGHGTPRVEETAAKRGKGCTLRRHWLAYGVGDRRHHRWQQP